MNEKSFLEALKDLKHEFGFFTCRNCRFYCFKNKICLRRGWKTSPDDSFLSCGEHCDYPEICCYDCQSKCSRPCIFYRTGNRHKDCQ
jgi:hypothetical protein